MKIGIIGAGKVGGTLGTGWRRKGHDVMFGVRDLADAKLQALLKETGPRPARSSRQLLSGMSSSLRFLLRLPRTPFERLESSTGKFFSIARIR